MDLDAEGYLMARGDFPEPAGPSFWNMTDTEDETRSDGSTIAWVPPAGPDPTVTIGSWNARCIVWPSMSSNDIGAVRPGWVVRDRDGEKIGEVAEIADTYLLVERGLFAKERIFVPLAALEQVDDGEITIDVAGDAIGERGWDTPPEHGPRRTGRPLNEPEPLLGDPRYDAAYSRIEEENAEGISYSAPEDRPATVLPGDESDADPSAREEGPRRRF